MVKKRGSYERIEKVIRKKRTFCPDSETRNPPLKKGRNLLNDRMLGLYKENVPTSNESSTLNSSSISEKVKSYEKEKPQESNEDTKKSKLPGKSRIYSENKKSINFGLRHSSLKLADVGGISQNTLKDILKNFLSVLEPKLFEGKSKLKKSRSFLLHGPIGCGKTHFARAIAGQLKMPYIEVNAVNLVWSISEKSENKIQEMFDEAIKSAPCILLIDNVDLICSNDGSQRGMEMKEYMVQQLLECFDELNEKRLKVVVIGCTSRPDVIDPCLRCGGRFSAEYAIGDLDEEARYMVLKVLCKNQELKIEDCDLKWFAHNTPGCVAVDLETLVDDAIANFRERMFYEFAKYATFEEGDCEPTSPENAESMYSLLMGKWEAPEDELNGFCFELQDFKNALENFVPCFKRENVNAVPDVTWDDVGALKDIKEELQLSFMLPIKYRKRFQLAGVSGAYGILLHGPKGCGKTLLAKAIANECSLNFLSVKGPEFFDKYVGESERRVREFFQKARRYAPCVVFFDEIDGIAAARSDSSTSQVANRVVNQLLTELDGMAKRGQIFVIGATNFLKKVDSAMLRPGRLDQAIYIGLPSADEREDILNSLTKNKTQPEMADDVDFKLIAADERCKDFSGADLAHLINRAFKLALQEHVICSSGKMSDDDPTVTKFKHFEEAWKKVKASVHTKKKRRRIDRSMFHSPTNFRHTAGVDQEI